MSYAKLDDLYDDKRKVKRAWKRHRAAVGLHVMAIAYCTRNRTDGLVDIDWLEEKLPNRKEREAVLSVMVALQLFDPVDAEHWRVHDYLEWNESKAERDQLAANARSAAKARWKKKGDATGMRSACDPHSDLHSDPHADGNADRYAPPHHTTLTTPPAPPAGGDARGGGRGRRKPQPPDPDAYPTDLPDDLRPAADHAATVLARVSAAKGAKPVTLAAAGRIVADYPRHDHRTLTGEFEQWWVYGQGASRQMRDVALTYRNRLSSLPAPPTSGNVHPLPGSQNPADVVARLNAGQARLQAATPRPEDAA